MNDHKAASAGTVLVLEMLKKSYPAPEGLEAPEVLKGVNFSLSEGERVAVKGPSGSGKSTLLNLIGALDYPSDGRILFRGSDIGSLEDKERSRFRNRSLGFIFQLHHLLPQCTVMENLLLPLYPFLPKGGKGKEILSHAHDRASAMLNRVGLSAKEGRFPGTLSGGERQRVAAVRALINNPDLLLADEPTGSLDGSSSDLLMDMIEELQSEKRAAMILVTHNNSIASRADRVLELRGGYLA
jgi:lipoprotein-releasing system ATP-binding protein